MGKITGGHFQPLPGDVTESTILETLTEEERTALVFYFYGNAINLRMILAKFERGTISGSVKRHSCIALIESARYLTVLGNLTMPGRLGENFSADLEGLQ